MKNPNRGGAIISKIPLYFFRKKKNCKDLGVGQDLTEFAKIPVPEYLRILTIFNRKS
jgi:hypothetical protein